MYFKTKGKSVTAGGKFKFNVITRPWLILTRTCYNIIYTFCIMWITCQLFSTSGPWYLSRKNGVLGRNNMPIVRVRSLVKDRSS